MKRIPSFNIVANAIWGPEGLSGGDAIFIEIAKSLKRKKWEVNIFTWEDGYGLCQNNQLTDANYYLVKLNSFKKFGFYPLYLLRTIYGIKKMWQIMDDRKFANKKIFIYSASDFWPDLLPAFFLKKRLSRAKWIAGFY